MYCSCLAAVRFSLEQRILELESGRLEHHVRREDHAALQDERDTLAARLREATDTEHRLNRALEAEREEGSQAVAEVKRLNQLLAALEAASAGGCDIICLAMVRIVWGVASLAARRVSASFNATCKLDRAARQRLGSSGWFSWLVFWKRQLQVGLAVAGCDLCCFVVELPHNELVQQMVQQLAR